MTQTSVFTKKGPQPTSTTNTPLIPTPDLVDLPPQPQQPQQLQSTLTPTHTKPPNVPGAPKTSPASPFSPFAICKKNSALAIPRPVRWLWQNRLPLAGITLLDGDHGLGKSLLTLQIAAAVSSGSPMSDGSPTIQGGVIIITPFTDASTTQLQQLTALGADLEQVKFLSFIHDPASQSQDLSSSSSFPASDYRPFSLPEDLPHLLDVIECVNARLIILDPFIYLLSRHHRYTHLRLCHLLTDLEQLLIERDIACLLVRNCRARGGHAKPSTLEKSDHFLTIAVNRLLLAPDPMQPEHILLSHALCRHNGLTQTLTLQIQPLPTHPDLPYITTHGHHILEAEHLLTQRPSTLHRHLLAQHLLALLAHSAAPIHATTFYTHFPHSSISQIQHTLKDLLLTGQIQRPARGLYASCPITPNFNSPAATTLDPTPITKLNSPAATTLMEKPNASAATTPTPKLNSPAATTPTPKLNSPAATTPKSNLHLSAATPLDPIPTNLVSPAAITPDPTHAKKHHSSAATTPTPTPITKLDHSPATTPNPTRTTKLNPPAATTSDATVITKLDTTAATTSTELVSSAAITPDPTPITRLDHSPATTPTSIARTNFNHSAATTPKLNSSPATTSTLTATRKLDATAATTPTTRPPRPPHPHKHPHKQKKAHGRPR